MKNREDEQVHCIGITSEETRPSIGHDATSPEPNNGKKSDNNDVYSAVPGSSRHTKIVEDEESKLSKLTGSGEETCQETCLSRSQYATAPELKSRAPTAGRTLKGDDAENDTV